MSEVVGVSLLAPNTNHGGIESDTTRQIPRPNHADSITMDGVGARVKAGVENGCGYK